MKNKKVSNKQILKLYIKDKNLLQLPIFYFGKQGKVPKETITEWKDDKGQQEYKLICSCRYGVPCGFEMDVYTACMRIWVKQGMKGKKIYINYIELAKELNLKSPKNWVGTIKKSLLKLGQARYHFVKCFLKGNSKHQNDAQFSLFDTTNLFSKSEGVALKEGKSYLEFPDILIENIEAEYYQKLDMGIYKILSSGLERRLYEYLEKRRYHNIEGIFHISEQVLCRWLPIKTKHTTNRRKLLEKISKALIGIGYLESYSFDKKSKNCNFTYAETIVLPKEKKVQPTPEKLEPNVKNQVIFVDVLDWLSSIPYFHKKKRHAIAALPLDHIVSVYPSIKKEYEDTVAKGQHLRPSWIYNAFVKGAEDFVISKPTLPVIKNEKQADLYEGLTPSEELCKILKKRTKSAEKLIVKYLKKENFNYVKCHIEYANKHSQKSYSSYLGQALKEGWALAYMEELEFDKKNTANKNNTNDTLKAHKKMVLDKIKEIKATTYDSLYFDIEDGYGLYLKEKDVMVVWKDVELEKLK